MSHLISVLVLKRSILTEKVARRGFHVMREYAVDPLEAMFVREVMDTDVYTVEPDQPLAELYAALPEGSPQRRQRLYPGARRRAPHWSGLLPVVAACSRPGPCRPQRGATSWSRPGRRLSRRDPARGRRPHGRSSALACCRSSTAPIPQAPGPDHAVRPAAGPPEAAGGGAPRRTRAHPPPRRFTGRDGRTRGELTVERALVGFDQDEAGEWVALLACGHRQHVRHRPPWRERPWVLTEEGRTARLGSSLECRICDEEGGEPAPEGGDPACWANQVCPDCGAIDGHTPSCSNSRLRDSPDPAP